MDYDEDYEVFEKWFSENELRFAHGQFSDKQIAYSAWLAGRGAVEHSVQSDEATCTTKYHAALAEKGDTRCGVCGSPLRR